MSKIITPDNEFSYGNGSTSVVSYSTSFSVGNFPDRVLVAGMRFGASSGAVTATYGGVTLSPIDSFTLPSADNLMMWALLNPTIGSNTLAFSWVTARNIRLIVASFYNVKDYISDGNVTGGRSTNPSMNIASAVGEMALGWLEIEDVSTITDAGGQTRIATIPGDKLAAARKDGAAGSVNMAWTLGTSRYWGISGVRLQPVPSAQNWLKHGRGRSRLDLSPISV